MNRSFQIIKRHGIQLAVSQNAAIRSTGAVLFHVGKKGVLVVSRGGNVQREISIAVAAIHAGRTAEYTAEGAPFIQKFISEY